MAEVASTAEHWEAENAIDNTTDWSFPDFVPSGLMDRFFANDKISEYDWSNGASRCIMAADHTPCCTADLSVFNEWTENAWDDSIATECKDVYDPVPFNCNLRPNWAEYTNFTCPDNNRQVCMYDKNGFGCCTEDIDMAHSWMDTQTVDNYYEAYYMMEVKGNPAYEDYRAETHYISVTEVSSLYALSPVSESQINLDTDDMGMLIHWDYKNMEFYTDFYDRMANRFNFECPTYLPVPIVGIMLGIFIPLLVIGGAIGYYFFVFKKRNQDKKYEEETGENLGEETDTNEEPPSDI